MIHPIHPKKLTAREQAEADIQKFIASGKQITEVPKGATGIKSYAPLNRKHSRAREYKLRNLASQV